MGVKSEPRVSAEQRPQRKRGPKRKFDDEFLRNALEQMKSQPTSLSSRGQLGIRRKWLYYWRDEATGRVSESKPSVELKPAAASIAENRDKRRLAELVRLVARQALEADFFRRCLAARRGKTAEA